MKIMKVLTALISLALLAACEESTDDYVGRWAATKGRTILQIADIGKGRVEAEIISYMMHQRTDSVAHGKIEDGLLILGQPPFGETLRYDSETDRIIGSGTTYRPVPEGWMWRDGFDDLEN